MRELLVGLSSLRAGAGDGEQRHPPPCYHGIASRDLRKELPRNGDRYLGLDVGAAGWVAGLAGAPASATGFAAS